MTTRRAKSDFAAHAADQWAARHWPSRRDRRSGAAIRPRTGRSHRAGDEAIPLAVCEGWRRCSAIAQPRRGDYAARPRHREDGQKDETTRRLIAFPRWPDYRVSNSGEACHVREFTCHREARSKTAWRKINDLGTRYRCNPSKIAYWPLTMRRRTSRTRRRQMCSRRRNRKRFQRFRRLSQLTPGPFAVLLENDADTGTFASPSGCCRRTLSKPRRFMQTVQTDDGYVNPRPRLSHARDTELPHLLECDMACSQSSGR